MIYLDEILQGVKTVGITGHIRPDGDCVGSTLGVYNYICDNMPQVDVDICLQPINDKFLFLRNSDKIKEKAEPGTPIASRFSLVPVAGLEPARYRYRWILSPLRLPISPPGHCLTIISKDRVSCKDFLKKDTKKCNVIKLRNDGFEGNIKKCAPLFFGKFEFFC